MKSNLTLWRLRPLWAQVGQFGPMRFHFIPLGIIFTIVGPVGPLYLYIYISHTYMHTYIHTHLYKFFVSCTCPKHSTLIMFVLFGPSNDFTLPRFSHRVQPQSAGPAFAAGRTLVNRSNLCQQVQILHIIKIIKGSEISKINNQLITN